MTFPYALLPHVNAVLNGTSGLFLLMGFFFIRRKSIKNHRACMIGALTASSLFLVSYLVYHAQVGSVRFQGEGWLRPVYFTILISHSVLAAAIVPLALVTVRNALKERFARHARIARWTFPIWMYVSITGIIVYLMLYHL